MKHHPSVAAQLAQLPELPMADLWALWDAHFAQRPRTHHRGFVESRLAYQIQAKAYGGLDASTRRKLERIGQSGSPTGSAGGAHLAPGTVLIREHDGIDYRVTVLTDGGFDLAGKRFKSLSAVARHITGTQWNGHRFFGLRGGKA
ncbi:MAG: DUF2924 domain-containing protein [Gemmataceae bacterium]